VGEDTAIAEQLEEKVTGRGDENFESDYIDSTPAYFHKKYIRYGLVARICRSHAVPTRPGFNSPCRNYHFAPSNPPAGTAKGWKLFFGPVAC
jgi:hypothetical protein